MLKHSVKLSCYLSCSCVAECHGMACVFCCAEWDCSRILHSIQHTRHAAIQPHNK